MTTDSTLKDEIGAIALEPTRDEADAGIVAVTKLTFRNLAFVVVETRMGTVRAGISASRNEDVAAVRDLITTSVMR